MLMRAAKCLQRQQCLDGPIEDSLLQFAYDFINNFILTTAAAEPPFAIPQLQFVKGTIAYSEKLLDSHAGGRSTSHRAS